MPNLAVIGKILSKASSVYISDDFIDVAKANITPTGLGVYYLMRFPLLKNIKGLTYEEAGDEIERVLDKAFGEKEVRPHRIAVNLRNEFFILRRFAFREIPDNELKKAIIFESQKYTPMPIEELTFNFQKCSKKEGLQEIIFVASETKHIQGTVSYFTNLGMLPSIIEPTPVLISEMLRLAGNIKKEKAYLSIHYEPSNKLMITGIYHNQAHFFKETNIFPGEEAFKTSEMTYPTLKDMWPIIESDVFAGMAYLKKETQKAIDKIFVSGFSPAKDEIDICKECSMPVERLDLARFKPPSVDNVDRFVPALSLLYDTINPPALNLAPDDVRYRDAWAFKPVAMKAGLMFLAIMILHFMFAAIGAVQVHNIAKLKKDLEVYKIVNPNATQEEVLRYKTVFEEKVAFIEGLISNRLYLAEKLDELPKAVTSNAWIDSLDFRNPIDNAAHMYLKIAGGVYLPQIGGGAEVNSILEQIKQDKKMMERFKEAQLASVKNTKILDKEITQFEIVLK